MRVLLLDGKEDQCVPLGPSRVAAGRVGVVNKEIEQLNQVKAASEAPYPLGHSKTFH